MPFDALSNLADTLGYGGGGEVRIDPYLPIWDHCDPEVMILTDGSVFATARMSGPPFPLMSPLARNGHLTRHTAWLNAVAAPNTEVFEHFVRHDGVPPPPPRPPERSAYAARFLRDWNALHRPLARVNDWFVTALVRPRKSPFQTMRDTAGEAAARMLALASSLAGRGRAAPEAASGADPELMAQLDDAMRLLRGLLRSCRPVRLGTRCCPETGVAFSEMAEAIELVRTSKFSPQPFVHPVGALGAALGANDPIGHRRGFEVRYGPGGTDAHHGCMYGITQYPAELCQDKMDDLLKLDGRIVITNHIKFFDRAHAQEDLALMRRIALSDANPALGDGAEMNEAIRRAARGEDVRGATRWSLAIHADGDPSDDPEAVERSARRKIDRIAGEAKAILGSAGLRIMPEGRGNKNSHIAQTPGAPKRCLLRQAKHNTEYVASMSTLAGYATGSERFHLGAPTLTMLTMGDTVYQHEPFVKGVGHKVIVARSGNGKTVYMAGDIIGNDALVREPRPMHPKGGTQIVIDVDNSNEQTILFMGGAYTSIRGGGEDSGVVPWRLPNTKGNRAMLRAFIPGLCQSGGGPAPDDEDLRGIREGVDFMMNVLAPEHRHLGVVRAFMPFRKGGAGAYLERWCRQYGGDLAWAFDGAAHTLDYDVPLAGTDVTGVMNDNTVMPPMGMFLLWLASEQMDGRRCFVYAEEAPSYFGRPEFEKMGKMLMFRARKRNVSFNAVAQMPESLAATEAGRALIRQSQQIVMLPDDSATWEGYGPNGLDVPAPIFEMVRKGMFELPYRAVAIHRSDGQSTINRFDLGGMPPEHLRVLSATTNSVALLRSILAKNGTADMDRNLDEFNARYHEAAA